MVLDLFLVAAELCLHLVQGRIDRRHHVVMALVGYEVVLVFGLDEALDLGLVFLGLLEIDRDLDHGQSVEDVEEFESFLPDDGLIRFAEVPVAVGYLDLHEFAPC